MTPLLKLLPITEAASLAACGLCHRITTDLPAGYAHLEDTHPRRYALAKEHHGSK